MEDNSKLFDKWDASVYEGENPELFEKQIAAIMTGQTLEGMKLDKAEEQEYDFFYVADTYGENAENYADIGKNVIFDTVYGDVELSSVSRDDIGRFNLQEEQLTGTLLRAHKGLEQGQKVVLTGEDILAVTFKDKGVTLDTSIMNPDFDGAILSAMDNVMDWDRTFRCYVENDKSAFDVCFFTDENKDRCFYVEDTGDYPLITGKLTQDEEFSPKTAVDILSDMGQDFGGSKDFIVFDIKDRERTANLIEKSRDMDRLPVTLSFTEHLEEGNTDNVYHCCDDLNARLFAEVRKERAEVQGVGATFEIESPADNVAISEHKEATKPETEKAPQENTKTDKADVVALFKAKTNELFHEIDGKNAESIENIVRSHVEASIDFFDLDAQVVDVVLVGSRCRGLEREDSDVDVVVEFNGSEREDALFDMLNEDGLMVGDKRIDINPITEGKTGTMAEYLPGVEEYLAEKAQNMEQTSQVMATDKAVMEEEEREKKKGERPSKEANGKFANFEFVKSEKDKRYFMYADIQFPSGEIERHKPIAEFPDKKAAVNFCKKNNIVFEDSTNNIDNVIRHKKKLSNEKGQDKSDVPQRSRGNSVEDN